MKNILDRRSFLKASGVCMALPLMPSLLGQSSKNSETSPWEITNKKSTVIDIEMRIFAKVRQ